MSFLKKRIVIPRGYLTQPPLKQQRLNSISSINIAPTNVYTQRRKERLVDPFKEKYENPILKMIDEEEREAAEAMQRRRQQPQPQQQPQQPNRLVYAIERTVTNPVGSAVDLVTGIANGVGKVVGMVAENLPKPDHTTADLLRKEQARVNELPHPPRAVAEEVGVVKPSSSIPSSRAAAKDAADLAEAAIKVAEASLNDRQVREGEHITEYQQKNYRDRMVATKAAQNLARVEEEDDLLAKALAKRDARIQQLQQQRKNALRERRIRSSEEAEIEKIAAESKAVEAAKKELQKNNGIKRRRGEEEEVEPRIKRMATADKEPPEFSDWLLNAVVKNLKEVEKNKSLHARAKRF